jgi:hypothetical protein
MSKWKDADRNSSSVHPELELEADYKANPPLNCSKYAIIFETWQRAGRAGFEERKLFRLLEETSTLPRTQQEKTTAVIHTKMRNGFLIAKLLEENI